MSKKVMTADKQRLMRLGAASAALEIIERDLESFRVFAESGGVIVNERVLQMKGLLAACGRSLHRKVHEELNP